MILWRITRAQYVESAWTGDGGQVASGRWHTRGRRIVYAAEHPAVCALEVLVHLPATAVPLDLYLCRAELPVADTPAFEAGALPRGWEALPPTDVSRWIGDAWLEQAGSVALRVPSVAAPRSTSVLLNPEHAEWSSLVVHPPELWRPDHRLFSGR